MNTNLPGFTKEALSKVEQLLYGESQWPEQFATGKTRVRLPRENKTTIAQGLPDMDIDDRPGRQPGDEGKQKEQDSEALFPVALPRGNPQQGPRSRSDLTGLRMFEEAPTGCRPKPQPRSTEQRQSTQQAQQAAQQQGQTFDQQPQQQVRDMASQGGQAERKKTLPICPNSPGAKP